MDVKEIQEALKAPFDQCDIKFRFQSLTAKGDKALLLPYVDARAVAERLDSVLGIDGWEDEYTEWQSTVSAAIHPDVVNKVAEGDASKMASFLSDVYQKGVKCTLKLKLDSVWIKREDGAPNTSIEGTKGGYSQAFRRAAVKFGVGRYLYDIPDLWVQVTDAYQAGKESAYYKGKSRYYTKPDLAKFIGGEVKEQKKSTSQKINEAPGGVPDGISAMDSTTFKDYQSRLAKISSGNQGALKYLGEAANEKDSMGRIKKLLGTCFSLFPDVSKERVVIGNIMKEADPSIGDMALVLKNSVMALEVNNAKV